MPARTDTVGCCTTLPAAAAVGVVAAPSAEQMLGFGTSEHPNLRQCASDTAVRAVPRARTLLTMPRGCAKWLALLAVAGAVAACGFAAWANTLSRPGALDGASIATMTLAGIVEGFESRRLTSAHLNQLAADGGLVGKTAVVTGANRYESASRGARHDAAHSALRHAAGWVALLPRTWLHSARTS